MLEVSSEEAAADGSNTEATVIEPADGYLVPEENSSGNEGAEEIEPVNNESEISAEDNTGSENATQEGNLEGIEAVNNSIEPAIVKPKQAEGYWIEVSGDRDVLVKYH